MSVAPTIDARGAYTIFTWVLTAQDQVADPTPPILNRGDKTVDMNGTADANGWNGATIALRGDMQESGAGNFKTLRTTPDEALTTTLLSFTASPGWPLVILPNVTRLKPVVTAGTVGATGVTIVLGCTSARSRAY